ncbi:GRB10-interacting GYF protein 2-like, partial [Saccostrea cucullata]|uniref:GRB10-interacting GYF protein 2-like n=1 Tax=Saccostrea cuccullata TaxID=36930 RepID=UPI002ED0DDBF
MALTNAEKQRRYREKRDSDPQRRSEYLQKKRQKYIQDVAVGKRKHIEQLSSRDQRQLRRTWRKNQKVSRKRKKDKQNLLTPPDSPILLQPHQQCSGTKRREKSRAQCYRDKRKLQEQLLEERKKKMMYMKRWLREKEKNKKCPADESPHTKSKKLLRGVKFNFPSKKKKSTVRRSLEFHFVLTKALRQKYRRGSQKLK